MARRAVEPSARVMLSPSCDLILSRTSAILIRGDRVWRLDDREAKKLAETIGGGTLAEAVVRLLAPEPGEAT